MIGFFVHQLKLKIRTERMRLLSTDLSECWVKVASLVRVNRFSFDFLFNSSLTNRDSFLAITALINIDFICLMCSVVPGLFPAFSFAVIHVEIPTSPVWHWFPFSSRLGLVFDFPTHSLIFLSFPLF